MVEKVIEVVTSAAILREVGVKHRQLHWRLAVGCCEGLWRVAHGAAISSRSLATRRTAGIGRRGFMKIPMAKSSPLQAILLPFLPY